MNTESPGRGFHTIYCAGFADDLWVSSRSQKELQAAANILSRILEEYALALSLEKKRNEF